MVRFTENIGVFGKIHRQDGAPLAFSVKRLTLLVLNYTLLVGAIDLLIERNERLAKKVTIKLDRRARAEESFNSVSS